MNNDKFSVEQLTNKISDLELEIARLKTVNAALQNLTTLSSNDQEDTFSLRQIIMLMPGNVYWKDKNGIFLGCNNNVAKILKLDSPNDIIGKRLSDLMDEELALKTEIIDVEVLNSTEGKFFEEPGIDVNGEPAIYYTHKLPLRDNDNNIVGILGISIDITARKKIEEELQFAKEKAEASNRAKSQFLAVVNHELRTPLTGIIGLANILKPGQLSKEEEISTIEDLVNCAEYLHTLVNDVLDFTKLDAGKASLIKKPVDINKSINEVISMLAPLAKNKNLDLHSEINNELPILSTDPRILRQILINLVNNAIKFTEKGSIVIRAHLKQQGTTNIILELSIQDTGFGIPHDKLDQIFEPFKQLEDTYIRQSSRGGTGLGLAIVKRLAKLLNCDIQVSSEFGKGSIFSVLGEFEVSSLAHKSSHSIKNVEVKHPIANSRIKTLVVEDDKVVQHIHKKMLLDLGCDVDIASYGSDALQILEQHQIVFVDIGLSDMTGFEVIKKMRARKDINQNKLFIIALTGYTGEQERLACIASGANEVAAKPISKKQLHDLLERYCG